MIDVWCQIRVYLSIIPSPFSQWNLSNLNSRKNQIQGKISNSVLDLHMCHLILHRVCTDLVVSAVVTLRCVITTPFGRPVDPLELSINAGRSLVCLSLSSHFSDGLWVTMDIFPLWRLFCSIFCITTMDVGSKISSRDPVFFGSDLPFESQTNTLSTLRVSKYSSSLVSHTDIEHITILGCETDNACSHSPGNTISQDFSFRLKRFYYCP